ncbi:thymidylate synthase [Bacillus cereus]|uniref:thymidylate synthase n=1 Tax=Bacillus sp. BB56-3 TaxID=2217831 RepID=UPI0015D36871|nr:thymidylate synthase [Bacillus sp. BB56-3]MCU4759618.1 thymidylate synthase [Bacillus cereus]
MYLRDSSFDNLYAKICHNILQYGKEISPRGLKTREIMGSTLVLENPRTRILQNKIRNISLPFAIGEWLWCMQKSNLLDIIQYYAPSYYKYSDDGKTLHGAYGPRILEKLPGIITILKKDRESRRGVCPVFLDSDVNRDSKDIPCTTNLHFLIRNNKLDLIVHMRSNDIYLGLPYDVFNFTMIQEYCANLLDIELGTYTHMVNSIHVYENQYEKIHTIASNSPSKEIEMKRMPKRDLEKQMSHLLIAENLIRNGTDIDNFKLNEYFSFFLDILIEFQQKRFLNSK